MNPNTKPRLTMMKLHDTVRVTTLGLALCGAGLLAVAPKPAAAQQAEAGQTQAQAAVVPDIAGSTVLLSSDLARLELELASGETHSVELNDGQVLVDGDPRGTYRPGGPLERSWRDLLRSPEIDATGGLASLLAGWEPADAEAAEADASGLTAVLAAFDRYDPATAASAAPEPAAGADVGTQGSEHVTIVPRAGSIDQLAERLRELNRTMGRIAGEEFELNGDFALVVHDDYRITDGRTIVGDVALLGGTLAVDGDIEGDVLVLGGELLLEPGSLVMGDIRSMGGNVETTGATVTGEILALSAVEHTAGDAATGASAEDGKRHGAEWDYDRRRDRGFFGSIFHNVTEAVGDLIGTIVWLVVLTLLGALFVYFVPSRLEAISSEARGDVLRSFGVGLAGQLLFFPILLLLVVMIVTWLVIPFYLIAVAVAIPAGYVAAARGIGEAVVDRKYDLFERFDLNRQNTYYYVFNGFVVLLAPFALAAVLHLFGDWLGFLRGLSVFVGVVLTWAAATTGFGAIILTRGGGLVRDLPGFRKRRSVPLDDLRTDIRDPGTSAAHASDGEGDDVNADDVVDVEDDDA